MTRRLFLQSLTATAALPAAGPPNVILVLADDLGWHEPACYGNTFNRTPHIDRLAAEGMRFTQAYAAAPVCSPTRVSLMTGQHPARVGITDYLEAKDAKYLTPDHLTIAKALKPAGYVSGLIGKWHLMGDYALRKGDPKLHGFDEVICSESKYIGPGYYFHPYTHLPDVEARKSGEYLTDRLNQEAVDFIRRNQAKPFFLYLAHYAPHTRLVAKPELLAKYKDRPEAAKDHNNPELAAMLESIDEGIGMIRQTLQETGLAGNTVVIFLSDNGGESNVTSNAPLHGGKSQLYEGGIRVPMIVHWPGAGKTGTCPAPVTTTDLYPTILEMAGVRKGSQPLDGASLAALLRRPEGRLERPLYWHYPLKKPHFLGGRSAGAVRFGRYKLIEFFDTGTAELYDLASDPEEKRDIAAAQPGKRDELRDRLRKWRASLGARTTAD
jgi:arylsulfatase A